ncbi:phytanoyl-CoA dioxygenase family protein [Candidatus Vallotiella sp. (ex Adelges kitamiensis)]|uniref:phytanoyl-CoA dioxygenase family protein n=1 Tax=Candidatus Vallotiella sp. (ex Adelges kitamiensis) TaxID=2864217 RepID=UPI001CE27686|nr:phytanoyl-CoA dioxygenase family protein [Candidatus Vallotia sp. (ex Adelges kitamiensis)]
MAGYLSNRGQIEFLRRYGFVVIPGLFPPNLCEITKYTARAELAQLKGAIEFESDLRYLGAPQSRDAPGGNTVRRLLDAYARSEMYRTLAKSTEIRNWVELYFDEHIALSLVHHNCLMTKHPTYGSLTGWHRDVRYWAFERSDLVSVWLALGTETEENGALRFVPGSHVLDLSDKRFDESKFFRDDISENIVLMSTAISPILNLGDAVFFHCNTLHSAGKNLSNDIKFSLVFTYHSVNNAPVPGTRSASKLGVPL